MRRLADICKRQGDSAHLEFGWRSQFMPKTLTAIGWVHSASGFTGLFGVFLPMKIRIAPGGYSAFPQLSGKQSDFRRRLDNAAKSPVCGGQAGSVKKSPRFAARAFGVPSRIRPYMSMPPGIGGGGMSFLGSSTMAQSVVSNKPAMDAAFCNAERVTLVGSIMPSFSKSPYFPLAAL